ncbi:2-keto-4-pentenoate hydratase [Pigmentiphaga sp. NML080357]|uniref:fumarylacetoacetate hydrolase family protein n=1 Tax=Pigmentiphaga sp. NML080357 TaxID=2008675 RepID=UPI000B415CB6|nr:fumarylacetoacetate hydrolase family protein [Pigmentiphaga sp. NML080357]OVZ60626.1 2-keto-4-pentenoate hydratase [Pigmentiphaga sp. NML080357]
MIQLVTFLHGGEQKTGLLHEGNIYASPRYARVQDVLDDWPRANDKLGALAGDLPGREPVSGATLLAPLPHPPTIYFAGANYRDHVEEMQRELSMPLEPDPKGAGQKPWHAIKASRTTVVGPDAQVRVPRGMPQLDWELELGVVIGKTAKDVGLDEAMDHVAGYVVANDLSARGHFGRPGVGDASPFKWDWIGQKSFDGACPLGPAITPARFVPDPMNLAMKLWVNDELMQDSNTSRMLFSIADQIAHLSSRLTLMPGDLILTGTPAGVGAARKRFLQPGDVVRQWIEHIGSFQFTIVQ